MKSSNKENECYSKHSDLDKHGCLMILYSNISCYCYFEFVILITFNVFN